MNQQIPLQLTLRENATFDNFVAGDNKPVIASLLSDEPYVYYWGAKGSGKTHLLHATCHQLQQEHLRPVYFSLAELVDLSPAVLEGLEQMDMVCLDDIEVIAGKAEWEQAIFDLYNRLREQQVRLRVAGNVPLKQLDIQLPDLFSRLQWGPVFQLHLPGDEQKRRVMQLYASAKGLQLNDDVADFLIHRSQRDLESLLTLLDELDKASLVEQRRLTIPFVKQYL